MSRTHLLLATGMAGVLLLPAFSDAQIVGGGGVIGGGVGGVGGTVGIGGAVQVPPTPRVREVPVPRATVTGRVAVPAVALPDRPRLGYLGAVGGKRRQALIDDGVVVLSPSQSGAYMDSQFVILRDGLADSGVTVVRRGDDIVLQLPADVTFAFNKSDLQPRFRPILTRVAATLNQFPATYVDVIGHADAIGSDDYNQALSERRAETVADFLVGHQALPARLYVAGLGESAPIASNATIYGRAANRRVEIILHPHA